MINLRRRLARTVLRLLVGAGLLALLAGATLSLVGRDRPGAAKPGRIDSTTEFDGLAPEGVTLPELGDGPGPFIVGDEPQPPHAFGDDADLDELWIQCADGSGHACDRLFDEAPLGSEYERFGVSCGERGDVLHCQEGLDGRSSEADLIEWSVPGRNTARDDRPTGMGLPGNVR